MALICISLCVSSASKKKYVCIYIAQENYHIIILVYRRFKTLPSSAIIVNTRSLSFDQGLDLKFMHHPAAVTPVKYERE